MTTAMSVLRRLQERAPDTGLTREFYTDPAIYALDLEQIFYREWLFAAHTSELPGTGSYLTLQIGAYPILLARAANGNGELFGDAVPELVGPAAFRGAAAERPRAEHD